MRNYGLVLVALVGLGLGCKGSSDGKAGDLSVSGSPTGEVSGQVRIVLAFSKPMIPRASVDKPVASPPLTLSPDIKREARWSDEKTLVVVATTSLPISTRFVATVPASTKALDGSRLGKAHTFEFSTERLSGMIDVVGSSARAKRDQAVRLSFNQEVPFEQVAQHCSFAAASKQQRVKLAPDSNAGPAKSFTVVPAGELTLDTDWTVSCRAALRGSVGNLGLDKPLEDKFHTYGPLRFVGLEPTGTDIVPDENLQLKLAFTNPLKPPYQMTLKPAVPGFPQRCHDLGDSPAGLSCAVPLEPRTAYTLTIDASQQDSFGQKLDKPQEISFRTTDAEPTVSLESGYFVAELKRPVLPVWTRNVTELQLRALKVTPANFHELSPLIEWWETTPADFSKTRLRPVDKKVAITGTKNKWGQYPIDPAQVFGGTPGPGMYYIELGSTEVKQPPFEDGGRQKILVNFTDIGVVSKLSGTRGLVWATRLSTGKALPGANVSVRDANGRQTWSGITDAEGVAVLPGTQ